MTSSQNSFLLDRLFQILLIQSKLVDEMRRCRAGVLHDFPQLFLQTYLIFASIKIIFQDPCAFFGRRLAALFRRYLSCLRILNRPMQAVEKLRPEILDTHPLGFILSILLTMLCVVVTSSPC
jgi:hypothetical protein